MTKKTEWHLLSASESASALSSSLSGLKDQQAKELLQEYGPNEIADHKKKTVFGLIVHQFRDLMILILAVAAILSGLLGDLTDAIVILCIILLNAVVGFIQEFNAEKAMEALKKMAASEARVIRENRLLVVPASTLVPGDVISLEAGDIIPADIRFIETHQLKADESALTGESENVEKTEESLAPGEYPLADRINCGYKGTSVTNGRARAIVTATGMQTELGRIAEMIGKDERSTPLQKRLSDFSKKLSVIVLIICTLFFLAGWLRGQALITMLLTSISLAVAAIPEALPALVTIALAFGARRLVKNKALIRKLHAVETLGSVSYIGTDKTGTLTLNKMTVKSVFRHEPVVQENFFEHRDALLCAMALNNDVASDGSGTLRGDSTEVALYTYAAENGYPKKELGEELPRIGELPFDSSRKCMSTVHRFKDEVYLITKGAVDELLKRLKKEESQYQKALTEKAEALSAEGFRVLGYGIRRISGFKESDSDPALEKDLSFLGFAAMIDPPREEAGEAVKLCLNAGIIPVMITGDHLLTAKAIAKKLGILSDDDNDQVLNGSELDHLNEEAFNERVEKIRVYARASPEQKLRIISALQKKGNFVAMTGDGVNDAPALRSADIGIAMGINGTEVSREAADMILLDDNFATIVKAIAHGRRIYDNILKFIKYIMTGNSGELWAILVAPAFGLPIPLIPIQILWVNLVSDGLPGLALASEPAEKNIMDRPPRSTRENVFAKGLGIHILWVGCLIGMSTIGIQAWALDNNIAHWQTMAFTVLCFSQLGHVLAIRSNESLFSTGLLSNKMLLGAVLITFALQLMIIYTPFFNTIFKTQPLSLNELLLTLAVSSLVFFAVEIEKFVKRRRRASKKNLFTGIL